MAIYGINTKQAMNVAGSFMVIDTCNEVLYVEGEDLKSPFFETQLPQEIIDKNELVLKEAREKKETELNAHCDSLLLKFSSNALGDTYYYDSRLEDQLNLIALVIAGIDGYFRCCKENEAKQNIPHTKTQLAKVFNDGMQYKASTIAICGALKAHLLTLDNKDDILALTWEDYQKIKPIN